MGIKDILENKKLNSIVEDSLHKTYKKYIGNSYIKDYINEDDFKQECYIYIMKYIKNFDEKRASINTYIPLLVMSCAKIQIRDFKWNKNQIFNSAYSLDMEFNNDFGEKNTYGDFISDKNYDLETNSINHLYIKTILESDFLSELEQKILKLSLNGYKQKEIAIILNCTQSRISQHLKKAKEKILIKYA